MEHYFPINDLKILKNSDFLSTDSLSTSTPLCCMVLFYGDDNESKFLHECWIECAKDIPGNILATCNLTEETKVADAFETIKRNLNHSLNWATTHERPFVLIYQNGSPTEFYNGVHSVSAICNTALSLSCLQKLS